jgi:hypothetical protein
MQLIQKTRKERILILAKTYPSPSAQHIETSCVAGINEDGLMRRLYPVPFRIIEQGQQFKKWQWIKVQIQKANKDHRPESHKVFIDTINCGDTIDTKKEWAARREWLEKFPNFDSLEAINASRLQKGISLALLRPKQVLDLVISKARNSDWTDEEKEKLKRMQMQYDLFNDEEAKQQTAELRKVPFDFYYRFKCQTSEGDQEYSLKIVDWEAGALFWNCRKNHGENWEAPFRAKLEADLMKKDLMFLIGNQHRFQDQWLIISLIYPPKHKPLEVVQLSLF